MTTPSTKLKVRVNCLLGGVVQGGVKFRSIAVIKSPGAHAGQRLLCVPSKALRSSRGEPRALRETSKRIGEESPLVIIVSEVAVAGVELYATAACSR